MTVGLHSRKMSESRVEVIKFVFPQHLNPRGKLYGGKMVRWAMEAGMLSATRHARKFLTLASMENLFFFEPVECGEIVSFFGQVDYAGRTSMEVSVEVRSEDPARGIVRYPCVAHLTYVALGEDGRPTEVPQLEPEFRGEELVYREALTRRESRMERIRARKVKRQEVAMDIPAGAPHTIELVREVFPEDAVMGDIADGGAVMEYLDGLGGVVCRRFSRRIAVTVAIDAVDFFAPLRVGDMMHIYAALNWAGRSAMEVGMKVVGENPIRGEVWHTCTAYFTYVAIGDDGKPTEVPLYVPETEEAKRRFAEAEKRQALRKAMAQEMRARRGTPRSDPRSR
ncbi:MAG: acyl-CoA thioesterase [bacterium JZ-2024 1]